MMIRFLRGVDMKDNLDLALAELINKAMSGVDKSVDFLAAEIPDAVNQLLVWNMSKHVILALLLFLLAAASAYIARRIYLYAVNKDSSYAFFVVFPFASGAAASIFTVNNFLIAVQIWIAPKVWLLEYAADLVK